MAWANIGASAFLFITRIVYLRGLLGKSRTNGKGKVI